MKSRIVAQWFLAIAVLVGMTWNYRETIRGLESKVVYQRRLINELRAEVEKMRGELSESIRALREDIKRGAHRVDVNAKGGGNVTRD